MKKAPVPYRRTVFVCTHARADGRTSCGNPGRGGVELCEALKAGVKRLGLKGKVRVARSGCLDLCEKGPNAFVYPDGEWLCGLTPADADAILEALARGA
ncbi:MAG: (2Fe-2S) ferredoxin domain-containing protein [Elusimicrobia bacterium]|nr:(2Fe-2S) ferredoxin domain-containing protein [Elusimicrobiota bacterium]